MWNKDRLTMSKWLLIGLLFTFFAVDDWYGNRLIQREIDQQANLRLEMQAQRIVSIFETYDNGVTYFNERDDEVFQESTLKRLKMAYAVADSYYRQYLRGALNKSEAQRRARLILSQMPYGETTGIVILNEDDLRLKRVNAFKYPMLKEELTDYDAFVERVNEGHRNGFAYYRMPLAGAPEGTAKKGLIMHFQPWDWELIISQYEEAEGTRHFFSNMNLTKAFNDTTRLLSTMDNLVVLSPEGYFSDHDPDHPQSMRIRYVEPTDAFYQGISKAPEGEKTKVVFPDGKAKWSYVLNDQYYNNWLIVIQDIDQLEEQKQDMVRFNRLIEGVNLLLIVALIIVFSSGVFERRE